MSEFRAQVLERIARGEAVCGVIGLGYVGLPLVMEIAGAGYRVLGFDVSRSVTDGLNAGKSHVQDVPAGRVTDGVQQGLFEATTDMGRLAEWILDHQVPLELSPSSNLQTGAAQSIATHPITRLKELGFAVTVNPDNRLMSATSVSREMRLLVDQANWTLDDLEWVTVTALGSSFLPYGVREAIIDEQLVPGFARASL